VKETGMLVQFKKQ